MLLEAHGFQRDLAYDRAKKYKQFFTPGRDYTCDEVLNILDRSSRITATWANDRNRLLDYLVSNGFLYYGEGFYRVDKNENSKEPFIVRK